MPNITLKATLQAYSKAPFYGDYIRQPESIVENYDKNLFYVMHDGQWVDLVEASSTLGMSIEEVVEQITILNNKIFGKNGVVENIDVIIDTNKLIFRDGNGVEKTYILPSSRVDNDSIGLNADFQLTTLNKPDNKTLKIVDVEYDDDGVSVIKKSAKLRVDAIYDADSKIYLDGSELNTTLKRFDKTIKSLEEYTLGTGGFLDPYNFGNLNIDKDKRNSILNNQAYEQLFDGIPRQIPDQTKIKNIYDGHIWVYIQKDNTWIDDGADTIVNANNDGVLGAVTGIAYDPSNLQTKFKVSIDVDDNGISNGKMSVNGLVEEFEQVAYKNEFKADNVAYSYVKRTDTGAIAASDALNFNEAVTLNQINQLLDNLQLTDSDIHNLVQDIYIPIHNGGNN